jgi:hypothetical protein
MKLSVLFLLIASVCFGQWVVHDPGNTAVNATIEANQKLQHLEILRQWTEQLRQLQAQLRELEQVVRLQRRIRDVLGDPVQAGTGLVLEELGAEELGQAYGDTLREIRRLADASNSLRHTAEDIYGVLEDRTSLGGPVTRNTGLYRRYAAVEAQAQQVTQTQDQVHQRVLDLQRDIGQTTQKLRTASTAAEVDKLNATLAALNGQLEVAIAARANEIAKLEAQQILNENQAAKEQQDLLERQIAEERQSLDAVAAWQTGLSLSPVAPDVR